MRGLSRLGAAVTLCAVVTGPPLVAVWWLRGHPWRPPTGDQARAWIQQPLTAGTIVAGMVLLGGLLWALIVAALIRTAATAILQGWRRRRQRRFGRMRLPTATELTAGSMTGVAALTIPAVVAAHPTPVTSTGSVPGLDSGDTTLHPTVDDGAGKRIAQAGDAGVDLPGGGWIPYRTAVAVTAVASLVWLHRRSRNQPTPHRFGGHDHDPDVQPLLQVVDAITAAVALDDPAPDRATLPLSADALPAGVLVLSGPGATAAARGLLFTAILGAHTGSHSQLQVTLRRRDLQRLLPGLDVDAPTPAGVHMTDAPDTATTAKIGAATPGTGNIVLVVTAGSAEADEPRPATVAVITDQARPGGWHVAANGIITGPTAGRRLCVLDQHTAADLIGLVQQIGAPAAEADPTSQPSAPAVNLAAQPAPASPEVAVGKARLTLMGDCRLDVDGTPVQLRRVAALQILAYLAVHADGATTADLVRAVWPGPPPSSITNRLHTTLTGLRQQLRPLLGGDPVLRRENRYLLNTALIDTDLLAVRSARTAAHALTGADRDAAYQQLIGGYHGELAAGHTWPWLQAAREALRRDVVDAHLRLAAATDSRHAAQLLRDAATIDPHNPHLHQRAGDATTAVAEPSTTDPIP